MPSRDSWRTFRPAPTPVELTDEQWAEIARLLPPRRRTGRPREVDLRVIVAAINHHWRTGCSWRKLPPGSPPWSTVYSYHRNWSRDGTLKKLREILNPPKVSQVCPPRKLLYPPRRLDPDRRPPAPPPTRPANPR